MFDLPVILLHVAEFHGTVNFASFDKFVCHAKISRLQKIMHHYHNMVSNWYFSSMMWGYWRQSADERLGDPPQRWI